MSKFLGYTVGLECNKDDQVGKSVMVEFSQADDGRVSLTPVSARNMGRVGATCTIAADKFSGRPSDKIAEARWALGLCGWTLMSDDYKDAHGIR